MTATMTLEPLLPSGGIGPGARIASGGLLQTAVDHLCEVLVTDAVYSKVEGTAISGCYDGRPAETADIRIKGAGGTAGIAAALALIGQRDGSETFSQHTARVARSIQSRGQKVGDHSGPIHGDPEKDSGCGACDKARPALAYIAANDERLAAVCEALGMTVDRIVGKRIAEAAAQLAAGGYVDAGKRVVDAIKAVGGDASVEKLLGEHREGAVAVNMVAGETLDKTKLAVAVGDDLQAFGFDFWATDAAAKDNAPTDELAAGMKLALVYWNLAVAAVLCDKSLRVVVRNARAA